MNVFEGLRRASQFRKDHPALTFEGKTWSYWQVYEWVLRVANGLRENGLCRGDRVGLFLPNIPEFLVSYYAIMANGAVAVSINSMNKYDEVLYILQDCTIRMLICSDDLLGAVPSLDDVEGLSNIYSVGQSQSLPTGVEPFVRLEGGKPLEKWEDLEPTEVAALLYTSGTTGTPKGAALTQSNLVSNVYATNHHTRTTSEDSMLCFLPLFHCFGQNFIMNAAVNAGSHLVLQRRFDPDGLFSSIHTHGVTMFYGVPTVFNRLLKIVPDAEQFESIRYFFSAAATMSVKVAQDWRERFQRVIYEGYGLTECSPFAAYNHDFQYRAGSVGTPIENVEMRIVGEEDEELADGELGEIVIRGPNVMAGYYRREEESEVALRGGWLHSGDIGYRDEDGFFFLMDRVKDMINVAGFKVWPREVEEVLYRQRGVAEVAVIGIPDADHGEAVMAVIVPDESDSASEEAILATCRQKIANYKVPRRLQFVDSLPKNPAGKILKKELRKRYGSDPTI